MNRLADAATLAVVIVVLTVMPITHIVTGAAAITALALTLTAVHHARHHARRSTR